MSQADYSTVPLTVTTKYAAMDRGHESRARHPRYGWCLRCGKSNREVKPLNVKIDERHSFGIACEDCWRMSRLPERLEIVRAFCRSIYGGHLESAFANHIHIPENDPEWIKLSEAVIRDWLGVMKALAPKERLKPITGFADPCCVTTVAHSVSCDDVDRACITPGRIDPTWLWIPGGTKEDYEVAK